MPPKADEAQNVKDLVDKLSALGFPQDKAAAIGRNRKQSTALSLLLEKHADLLDGTTLPPKQTPLLATLATSNLEDQEKQRYILRAILDERLASNDQLTEAIKYSESVDNIQDANFNKVSGVGVNIPPEEVMHIANDYINSHSNDYQDWGTLSKAITNVKALPQLRWASALYIKNAVDNIYETQFGPKANYKPSKPAKDKGKAALIPSANTLKPKEETLANDLSETRMFEEGWLAKLHKPGENPQIEKSLMQKHLEFTKGKVFTRFPPEPNGFMHIGHLKALVINFGFAAYHGGNCYLRYDDTNPSAEKQVYIDGILEMVTWLGFEAFKITFASDHFERLYECAVELVKRGKAYVDHSSADEMKEQRGGEARGERKASKWRDRPIQESLDEFAAMRAGKYKQGEAVLRMKMNLEDPNPQMWDLVAYRVLNEPHPRTGDAWRIYPTYDFTHCLNDSFENISHSLCTVEFVMSRQSYDWLCDALTLYKARQSEYGRLNIQGTITSKRKLRKLVDENHVQGWDDPRMPTLVGLRRRGVPPGALKTFISQLGVSTQNSTLPISRLEQTIRQYLEVTTPRLMLVLKPLKVIIENLKEDFVEMVTRPIHPKQPEMGTLQVPFTRVVYIDASDFREQDSKDYFRLAPGKRVGLLNVDRPIVCTSFKTDAATGQVTEVCCRYEDEGKFVKPKAYIHWVAKHKESRSPVKISEVRLFKPLFQSDNPALADDFLADLTPGSLEVIKGAYAEIGLRSIAGKALKEARVEAREQQTKLDKASAGIATVGHASEAVEVPKAAEPFENVRFQGLRTAYFCLDRIDTRLALTKPDSVDIEWSGDDVLVLNSIVSLKEDSSKKTA